MKTKQSAHLIDDVFYYVVSDGRGHVLQAYVVFDDDEGVQRTTLCLAVPTALEHKVMHEETTGTHSSANVNTKLN